LSNNQVLPISILPKLLFLIFLPCTSFCMTPFQM
jgi:hypothetical protein